jgi:DNA-binding IclR family transcriptional regulator
VDAAQARDFGRRLTKPDVQRWTGQLLAVRKSGDDEGRGAIDKMTEKPQRRVQSIEIGFRVLRVLRMAEGPLPLREIAARAEMPPSKTHLYLVSLVREDMAFQEPGTGHYGLGAFAIQLGLSAIRQLDVVSRAGDVLARLRDATNCAVYLSIWGDKGPCIVAKADGPLQGAFAIKLGYILPISATASGLAYLAWLPHAELLAIASTSQPGPGEASPIERLAGEIETVRSRGYASTVGRLNQNFAAIAAPVLGPLDNLQAVLTMLGPVEHMTTLHDQFVALTTSAAREIANAPPRAPHKP